MVSNDGSVGGSPFSDPTVRERVRELPPSTTLVALVLADHGPLTLSELAEETLLSRHTVQVGLRQLEAANLVESGRRSGEGGPTVYDITS